MIELCVATNEKSVIPLEFNCLCSFCYVLMTRNNNSSYNNNQLIIIIFSIMLSRLYLALTNKQYRVFTGHCNALF